MKSVDLTTVQEFHHALHRWYRLHGRKSLPWRNTPDVYAIWVSEVMLQQTQVQTVLERYYKPFLQEFPNVAALANAAEDSVLKAWEGLGYYSRARNLHKAAKQIAAGDFPNTVAQLMALPGIGQNTAHAIAAFGFQQPVPVLEANVKRVVARIFALTTPAQTMLWQYATQLLDTKQPFDYNQAMMDLGAMVCTVKAPRCGDCPAAEICQGKHAPELYPAKPKKKPVPIETQDLLIWQRNTKNGFEIALVKRAGGMLQGLYGLPKIYDSRGANKAINTTAAAWLLDRSTFLGEVTHAYSHFKVKARVYSSENATLDILANINDRLVWVAVANISQFALSKLDHKALELR